MNRTAAFVSILAAATLIRMASLAAAQSTVDEAREATIRRHPGFDPGAPMYIADPVAGDTFTAMPVGLGDGLAPSWPRWFAGAGGLVMTRTLPAGSATMQPFSAVQLNTSD
ncbi:MAG: hypothetical protein ACKO6E_06065, partial [Planctomycetota bacterium]